MDDCDRQLLMFLQKGLALEARPFETLGKKAGLDGAQTLLSIHRLMASGMIRHLGGIFDGTALGYQSTLLAMQFEKTDFEHGTRTVHGHPGVSRSWERDHDLNFWFVLSVPAGDGIEDHIERLHELAGSGLTLSLTPVRIFKAQGSAEPGELDGNFPARSGLLGQTGPAGSGPQLSDLEIDCIRRLQDDFPLCDTPYLRMARDLGMEQDDLWALLEGLIRQGYLKRIAALLAPVRPGADAREIVVWQVPEEAVERAGYQVSLFPQVVHCCQRIVYPEFPYSLFAGIQVPEGFLLQEIFEQIEAKIGKWPHRVLKTLSEPKRARLKYFSPELDRWRQEIGSAADVSRF